MTILVSFYFTQIDLKPMKILRRILSFCIALMCAAGGFAQTELPADTTRSLPPSQYLQFGLWGDPLNPAYFVSGTFGQTLGDKPGKCGRAVVLGSLGLNPGEPFWREPITFLRAIGALHLSVELRWYVAMRREKDMSGLFVGPAAVHEIWIYSHDHPLVDYSIGSYTSIGLTLGYEHAFGERARLSFGVVPAFPKLMNINWYASNEGSVDRVTRFEGYNLQTFARFGWVLKGKD